MSILSDVLALSRPQREAACALLYQLGRRPVDHSWNLLSRGRLAIPTCIMFARCGGSITQHAATVAFDLLARDRAIPTAELRRLGFDPPPARARYRWVVFDRHADREPYAEAHLALVAMGYDAPHPEEDTTPFAPFAPTDLPLADGRPVAVCCPFHSESRPSASIYPPSARGYGAGVCHKCRGPDGRSLRFCWRELPDGSFGARIARAHDPTGIERTPVERSRIVGRYNGRPVARCAGLAPQNRATLPPVAGVAVGVSLRSFVGRSGSWLSAGATAILRGGVLGAIVRAERTADYRHVRPEIVDHEFEAAARRERDAASGRPPRPGNADARDRLIRVQPQFSTETTVLRSGASIPGGWKDAGVANVLVDLDGLRLGSDATAREWAERALAIVKRDRRCSGRATVVRTSAGGAQVVIELARPIVGRLPGEAWFAAPGPRRWYGELSERLLAAAWALGAEGGEIDWSAFSPGRCARRPGWRVTRTGEAYRARLLAASA